MAGTIQQYHGEIRPCSCGAYDAKTGKVNPEHSGQRACSLCFGRGFVAECKKCAGLGQLSENMAGGPGTMKSTCIACGGTGSFATNKPEGWQDEPVAEAAEVA